MKKTLCGLVVAAFALAAVAPASAAVVAPRVAGDKPVIEIATQKKDKTKKTAQKKGSKKQVAKKGKKPASKNA